MNAPHFAWSLIPALCLLTTFARADVVPPLPDDCPPGTFVDYGCGSAFCRAIVCETDADCKGGDCEPVTACFGPNPGLQPPPTEHGGPCLRGDTCSEDYLTCLTLGLCLTVGDGTTSDATTAGATTANTTTTGTTMTGGPPGTSTEPVTTGVTPTSGDSSTSTASSSTGTPAGAGSSETSGGSEGSKGCSCVLTPGSSGVLAMFWLVAPFCRRPRPHR